MPRTFKVTGKETAYESPWLVVKKYSILRDDQPSTYEVVERTDGAVIIASTTDNRILFVKQYRFPTESYKWELPMGGIDPGETPAEAARRELREETGLTSQISEIGSFRPVPGLSPQTATVFTTFISDEDITRLEAFAAEVDEIVDRRLLSLAEIESMIGSGDIVDGFTLSSLAILKFQ